MNIREVFACWDGDLPNINLVIVNYAVLDIFNAITTTSGVNTGAIKATHDGYIVGVFRGSRFIVAQKGYGSYVDAAISAWRTGNSYGVFTNTQPIGDIDFCESLATFAGAPTELKGSGEYTSIAHDSSSALDEQIIPTDRSRRILEPVRTPYYFDGTHAS